MIKSTNRVRELGGAPLEIPLAARFEKTPAAGRLHIDACRVESLKIENHSTLVRKFVEWNR
ncbi:hypothetical protein [Murdochiella vaginalis]|uniref:hypothetical protein n=1 Tax=Murdochiella vaginalis TaxID=1852373 RepID=UPI0011CA8714|nr:hypothetical protein [Murdochiella vaginalis]